jgi:hypothetical protein
VELVVLGCDNRGIGQPLECFHSNRRRVRAAAVLCPVETEIIVSKQPHAVMSACKRLALGYIGWSIEVVIDDRAE